MPASFSFDPSGQGPGLASQAPLIVVQSFDGQSDYEFLPNVLCISITEREGEPASARFRYILDDTDPDSPFPDGFEDLIPVDAAGEGVVQQGDRLLVSALLPDGSSPILLFDGFAGSAEVALDGGSQSANFQALGVATRLYDSPIPGAKYRDADSPDMGQTTSTDLPVRFNPTDDRQISTPNATPDGQDENDGNGNYPCFLDPSPTKEDPEDLEQETEDKPEPGDTRQSWTLGMACRYLLCNGNPDEDYVQNPDNGSVDKSLQAITPANSGTTMNVNIPSTYTQSDIVVRDYDASNKPCMEAVKELLWGHGFRFRYDVSGGDDGTPTTTIVLYRRDGLFGSLPKALGLQSAGSTLDTGLSNVGTLRAQRAVPRFNDVEIETDSPYYEAAFILAPGFMVAVADGNDGGWKPYVRSNWLDDATEDNRQGYRLYVFDECGDGHWDIRAGGIWSTTSGDQVGPSLDTIFNVDNPGSARTYARRYRPGRGNLLQEENGVPFRSELAVSLDYAGKSPSIWDGSGTWQPITGGYRLLRTRLGIIVTADNPNAWDVGDPPTIAANDQVKNKGIFRSVEMLAQPQKLGNVNSIPFSLRLTTVIRGDRGIRVSSDRRPASPTPYTFTARVDCRDHFRKEVVDGSSPYRAIPTQNGQLVYRDDTPKAQAYSDALRSSGERGEWRGSVTIPRFTAAYSVGDLILGVRGRTTTFRTNAGSQAGEGDSYPIVTAITWQFEGRQSTTLELAEAGDAPGLPSVSELMGK